MKAIFARMRWWLFGSNEVQPWSEEHINRRVGRFTFFVIRPVFCRYRGFWRKPEFQYGMTLVSVFFNLGWDNDLFLAMQDEAAWTGRGEYFRCPPQHTRNLTLDRLKLLRTVEVPWRLETTIESVYDLQKIRDFFGKIRTHLLAAPDSLGGDLCNAEYHAIILFLTNLESRICLKSLGEDRDA
jgi:hypothetical protein